VVGGASRGGRTDNRSHLQPAVAIAIRDRVSVLADDSSLGVVLLAAIVTATVLESIGERCHRD